MKMHDIEIHVFEKSKDIYSSSISGIRADGKLFVSKEMGGELEVDVNLQKELVDFWISKTKKNGVETGKSFSDPGYYKAFYSKGFLPVHSDFYHLGTDQLKEVLYNIFEEYKAAKNIRFHFNYEVKTIKVQLKKVIINQELEFEKNSYFSRAERP